jgi:predicted nucleic acid-binding protein
MITAVDTSVLVDVLKADPQFGVSSARAMRASLDVGSLVVCEVVMAEVAAGMMDPAQLESALHDLRVRFVPADERTATVAGSAWQQYRRRGGRRDRIIADFIVGAHAKVHADRLLSRDRGFFRAYFADLTVVDPSAT